MSLENILMLLVAYFGANIILVIWMSYYKAMREEKIIEEGKYVFIWFFGLPLFVFFIPKAIGTTLAEIKKKKLNKNVVRSFNDNVFEKPVKKTEKKKSNVKWGD